MNIIYNNIKDLLTHPLTQDLDLDDPKTTELRRSIIREKPFLRSIYQDWYQTISSSLEPAQTPVLEIGSGGGFMSEFVPGLITSEVFYIRSVSFVLDGHYLPFADNALGAIVMLNVLHHLTDNVRKFFTDAARCVRNKGAIIMIEPWVTPWSKIIYGKLHHEPFQPEAVSWQFASTGPLSGANSALPWILFSRDRRKFEDEFPEW
jgi:SAM-dependent methyltransferase